MLFNSLAFAIFLPIVFILYWTFPHKYRWALLLAASYYFYMSWNAKYVFLILLTTITSYFAAILLEKEEKPTKRKFILMITLLICLGMLFFFKYFDFAAISFVRLLNKFSLHLSPITVNVLLPVGISFYTFQTLSYVIDVYRKKIKPEHHIGIYATFISFFPQLVAGPIERTENLLPQIKTEKKFNYDEATYGLKLIAWGFFKKLSIADVLAVYVDKTYSSLSTCTGFDLISAVLFFTIQIYCDFSGYSDIAIGTAKLMGIHLMQNFKSPYFSKTVKEFWNRWHISLSTWFKDYLYIPLGGNRCSKIRSYFNLMVTFLISGLWHGAGWTYVAWGGIHGTAQVFEKIFVSSNMRKNSKKLPQAISVFFVFIFCNFAWIFFRAENLTDACYIIGRFFSDQKNPSTFLHNTINLSMTKLAIIICSLIILGIYDCASLKTDVIHWISHKKTGFRWAIYIVFIFFTILTAQVGDNNFIYFQF